MEKTDRRVRCKHPATLTFLKLQQRYDRNADTAEPDKERHGKSGNDVYKSVYSSIAPLVLVDGHTSLVNRVFVRVTMKIFCYAYALVFVFEFMTTLEIIVFQFMTYLEIIVFIFIKVVPVNVSVCNGLSLSHILG
jgi:hypothetical protein